MYTRIFLYIQIFEDFLLTVLESSSKKLAVQFWLNQLTYRLF